MPFFVFLKSWVQVTLQQLLLLALKLLLKLRLFSRPARPAQRLYATWAT
jgi:hypothetical protein